MFYNFFSTRGKAFVGTVPADRFIGVVPFFHIYGQVLVFLAALSRGASIIILPTFEPESLLKAAQNHKVSFQFTIRSMTVTRRVSRGGGKGPGPPPPRN